MNRTIKLLSSLILLLLFAGCPSTHEVEKPQPAGKPVPEKKPAGPEITFQFATLDLGNHHGRIEQGEIDRLANLVRREKIDVFSVQGIIRYPGLQTRVDFVDSFSVVAEMRTAFGETINLNNRQGGNAVFSTFPIKTTDNHHYIEMQGNGFEAALQAVVDCGLRDVVFVSTWLPENPGMGEETNVMSTFTTFYSQYINHPIIISGNLPHSNIIQPPAAYTEVPLKSAASTKIWYSNDGSLKVLQTKTDTIELGVIALVQFGLFRAKTP
jgi:hypothetical protein